MTMMTVGHRYEYTRSNDRMWRKNTVGIWLVIIIMRMKTMLKITIASYNQAHMPISFNFSEFCVFLGGKPWFILHWGRFESQLSWRVRIQLRILRMQPILGSLWKIKPWYITDTVLEPRVTPAVKCSRDLTHSVKRSQGHLGWQTHTCLYLNILHLWTFIFGKIWVNPRE